jgi:hypothetical protein
VPSSAERDIPQILGNVSDAATSDIFVLQSVLTLSARRRPLARYKTAPEGAAVNAV